jgi:YbbR domain-containing protein
MSNKVKNQTGLQELSKHLLKLVSFFMAFFLWFYVVNSEPQEVVRKVKVTYKTPKGYAISNLATDKVAVRLKGSRAFMQQVFRGNEEIVIDIKSLPYKKNKNLTAKLTNYDVPVPFGVDVLSIEPEILHIKLDKEITKKVPVRLQLVGEVGDDLKLMKKSIVPTHVNIRGPIEVMRSVGKLRTLPIDVSSLEGKGEMKVGILPADPRIHIKRDAPLVFKYIMKPKKANLTLKKIKIRFISSGRRFSSKDKYASIDVLSPDDVKLNSSSVKIFADIPEGKKGTRNIKLEAKLPDGVHLLQINPQTIKVRTY